MTAGTLVVVGTGMKAVGQLTAEASAWIREADVVLHVVADAVTERAILALHPRAETMKGLYNVERRRLQTYEAMVARILAELRKGQIVCAVFYGHPGVFVWPSHEAVRRARLEGFTASMLPGVSAEDALIADLGIDPAVAGLQTFEATDFLVRPRRFDAHVGLVLWQIGAIGNLGVQSTGFHRDGVAVLVEVLRETYDAEHEVCVYEAAMMATCDPVMHRTPLAALGDAPITTLSTLYVPPVARARLDRHMVARLGLTPQDFGEE